MPTVRKSVIVARPCATMFALVDDVEHYPDFLPWCAATEVFERSDEVTRARIDIEYHGLESHIETRNRKQAPRSMALEFVEGPFGQFKGQWHFVPLGEDGCRVEFSLDYEFSNAALEAILGPVFGHIIETIVDHFVARSDEPHGPAPRAARRKR
jgi:ribosome-associated toxin RatA of RatAB toxin-antitoxin module